jgi:hypothetical protein
MTKKDLAKLRSRLPQNYRTLIQESLKAKKSYSVGFISMVLMGKTTINTDIIEAAIHVAEQHEAKIQQLSQAARGEVKLDKLKFNLQN